MIAPTLNRVENVTDPAINQRNRDEIRERIARYQSASRHELTYRLAELDQEWDIERILEFNFSAVVLGGCTLGTLSSRKWFALPAIAACFMVQHALEGWCPPLIILRRMGFRTIDEINHERMAVKILRGDFSEVELSRKQADSSGAGQGTSPESLLQALED